VAFILISDSLLLLEGNIKDFSVTKCLAILLKSLVLKICTFWIFFIDSSLHLNILYLSLSALARTFTILLNSSNDNGHLYNVLKYMELNFKFLNSNTRQYKKIPVSSHLAIFEYCHLKCVLGAKLVNLTID
jgi:hypothetical protein